MNIMMLKPCNCKCPYCFADDVIEGTSGCKKENQLMTMEDFKTAIDFAVASGEVSIGLIGGEPTLHPEFREFVTYVLGREEIKEVTLFTNATKLEVLDGLWGSKLHVLINFNAIETIGSSMFKIVKENIINAFKDLGKRDKITLGVNMYKVDFEYMDMIEVMQEIKYEKTLRVSVSVPMDKSIDLLEYFKSMKPSVFEFFRALEDIAVLPRYDCNLMPACVITEEEAKWLGKFMKLGPSNLLQPSTCLPVMDVLTDLTAIRCFGMSEDLKVSIKDFKTTKQVRGFFEKNTDHVACNIPSHTVCKNCKKFFTGECNGGCLAFKQRKINELRKEIASKTGGVIYVV